MYAVIETGGQQFRVSKGDEIFVEKLGLEENAKFNFDKVLLVAGEGKTLVGTPYVKAHVKAHVVKNGKGPKLIVFKYKDKNNDKVKKGHRQPYTKVCIDEIVLG